MNTEKFITLYNESRNGADHFVRHPLVRSFVYSDGVQSLAECGIYWALDILATELPAVFRQNTKVSNMATITFKVADYKALITAEFTDDVIAWSRSIDATDMPAGTWQFLIANDGDGIYKMLMVSEY